MRESHERRPDPTEHIVAQFLSYYGHSSIYEPAGNVSPDFLVDGRIAVEVRRLNQNYISKNGQKESYEEGWRKIFGKIERLAFSIKPPLKTESWFLGIDFKRPLDDWKILKPKVRAELKSFVNQSVRSERAIQLSKNFELWIFPASKIHSTFFVMGGVNDRDVGGWVIEEMGKNIQLCITEKAQKINKSQYPEWWLILVDHTGLGFDDEDYDQLRTSYSYDSPFDRVIIIGSRSYVRVHEIVKS